MRQRRRSRCKVDLCDGILFDSALYHRVHGVAIFFLSVNIAWSFHSALQLEQKGRMLKTYAEFNTQHPKRKLHPFSTTLFSIQNTEYDEFIKTLLWMRSCRCFSNPSLYLGPGLG